MHRLAIISLCGLAGAGLLWLVVEWTGSGAAGDNAASRRERASANAPRRLGDSRDRSGSNPYGDPAVSREVGGAAEEAPEGADFDDRGLDPDELAAEQRALRTRSERESGRDAGQSRDGSVPLPFDPGGATSSDAPADAGAPGVDDGGTGPALIDPTIDALEKQAVGLADEYGIANREAIGPRIEQEVKNLPADRQELAREIAEQKLIADQVILAALAFKKLGPDASPQEIKNVMDMGATFVALPSNPREELLGAAIPVVPQLPPSYRQPGAPSGSTGSETGASETLPR